MYLSENKNISDNYVERLITIFETIPNLAIMKDENIFHDNQIISNLICSFLDFVKIKIPDLLLKQEDLKVISYKLVLFYYIIKMA